MLAKARWDLIRRSKFKENVTV